MSFWRSKPPPGIPINKLHPLSQGLVGVWLMNEGGGGKSYDGSGYSNHGTLTNMANPPTPTSGWNPGKDGHALAFDGTDDFVNCGTNPILRPTNQLSIFALVKPNNAGDASQYIAGAGYFWGAHGYLLYFSNTNDGYYMRVGDGVSFAAASFVPSPTMAWHFIVGTWDGATIRLYIDGTAKAFASKSSIVYHGTYYGFGIGRGNTWGGNDRFNGQIAVVGCFNRCLTLSEVQILTSDPYCMYQQPRNVKYFIPTGVVEVYSSRGIGRGILRGVMR